MSEFSHLTFEELVALLQRERDAHEATKEELAREKDKTESFRKHFQNQHINKSPVEVDVSASAHIIQGLRNQVECLKAIAAYQGQPTYQQTFNAGSQATNNFFHHHVHIHAPAMPSYTPAQAADSLGALRLTDIAATSAEEEMEDNDNGIEMPIFSAPCFMERDQGVCKAKNCPRVHQMQRDKYGADALAQLPFDKNALRKAQERRG
jgi:hypothetical protein